MSNKTSRLGTLLLVIAILAAIAVAVLMFGSRLGLWDPSTGFRQVRVYLNPIGYVVTGLGVLGLLSQLVTRNGMGIFKTFLVTVIGLCILIPFFFMGKIAPPAPTPPIHDITTNMEVPPKFLVLDETRDYAKNSLVYGGPDVADFQKKFYSDIAPIETSKSPADAYAEALRVAQASGWEIVAQDDSALRYEATARTPVYNFADDVVVVVSATASGSRVDIRSVSRVGRGDQGKNAARVRKFIADFQK